MKYLGKSKVQPLARSYLTENYILRWLKNNAAQKSFKLCMLFHFRVPLCLKVTKIHLPFFRKSRSKSIIFWWISSILITKVPTLGKSIQQLKHIILSFLSLQQNFCQFMLLNKKCAHAGPQKSTKFRQLF